MCGINGILYLQTQRKVDEQLFTIICDALEHRVPDDKGIFVNKNIGLEHRRLSFLDVTTAEHQVFLSEDGRYAMMFNGEIYNFKLFYSELKSKGFEIRTHSDKEVLMKLFQLYGLKMLHRLNGMFAFAIWDTVEKKLMIARDRMGVKPLYYAVYNETFYFAFEQKALFTAGVPLKVAKDGIEEYIFNRFAASEDTLFQNVKKVHPGHAMILQENGKIESEKWWDLKHEIQNHEAIKNPLDWFKETFDDFVRLRMVSDVPVGVLLSAGLVSSSVLSSVHSQQFKDIQAFAKVFKEKEHNESHLAKRLAHQYHCGFDSIQLENDDLCSLLDRNDRCTMGTSIECREPFLDQRLLAGVGSLNNKWLFNRKKGKYILKAAGQSALLQEILSFKKVGLSTRWGDYITKRPVFKEEFESFSNSDLFQKPYFEHIKAKKLISNLQKGHAKMVSYIMPLFMMHIWLKNYVNIFEVLQKESKICESVISY